MPDLDMTQSRLPDIGRLLKLKMAAMHQNQKWRSLFKGHDSNGYPDICDNA